MAAHVTAEVVRSERVVALSRRYAANDDDTITTNEFLRLVGDLICLRDGTFAIDQAYVDGVAAAIATAGFPELPSGTMHITFDQLIFLAMNWPTVLAAPAVVTSLGGPWTPLRPLDDDGLIEALEVLHAARQPTGDLHAAEEPFAPAMRQAATTPEPLAAEEAPSVWRRLDTGLAYQPTSVPREVELLGLGDDQEDLHELTVARLLSVYDAPPTDGVLDADEFVALVYDILCLRDGVDEVPQAAATSAASMIARYGFAGQQVHTVSTQRLCALATGREAFPSWDALLTDPRVASHLAGHARLPCLHDPQLVEAVIDLRERRDLTSAAAESAPAPGPAVQQGPGGKWVHNNPQAMYHLHPVIHMQVGGWGAQARCGVRVVAAMPTNFLLTRLRVPNGPPSTGGDRQPTRLEHHISKRAVAGGSNHPLFTSA